MSASQIDPYGPGSKVVYYIGNRVLFGTYWVWSKVVHYIGIRVLFGI